MRINRKRRDICGCALPNETFDCRARLALVQHNGLIVEDAPTIEHVGVHSDGRGTAPWISASLPDGTRCFE